MAASFINGNGFSQLTGQIVQVVNGDAILAVANSIDASTNLLGVRLSDVLPGASGYVGGLAGLAKVRMETEPTVGNLVYLSATNPGLGSIVVSPIRIVIGLCYSKNFSLGVWYADCTPSLENTSPNQLLSEFFPDLTGMITVNSGTAKILFTDIFDKANEKYGWGSLLTPSQVSGTVSGQHLIAPVTTITKRGIPRLLLRTDDIASQNGMAIKRLSNWPEGQSIVGGRYLVEMQVVFEHYNLDVSRPLGYAFGLDTALPDGTRRFFQFRYLNHDNVVSQQKWQIQINTGTNAYIDITAQNAWAPVTNENKALPVYLAFIVNTATGKYEGFRIDGGSTKLALGTLANPSSTVLIDYGVNVATALTSFANGLNPTLEIFNRPVTATGATIGIGGCRCSYLNGGS
jgi:hypothetical protein